MFVLVLFASAQALSLRGLHDKLMRLDHRVANATNGTNATEPKPVNWDGFVTDYCTEFCLMKGVDAGHCTVCSQRMNFSVSEGKVSCDVECQGIQTDEVTESVVDCSARLDKCMFESVEPAECRLECGVNRGPGAVPKTNQCSSSCAEFKLAARADGHRIKTFYGKNYVETTADQNVTKEVNGSNVTVLEPVTTTEVVGVEALPTVGPGTVDSTAQAEFRFHVNESAWRTHAVGYCDKWYCGESGIDSWHCVECVNRLNNSVEHAMMTCRVGCDMHHTDEAKANELIAADTRCDQTCLTQEFEAASCRMECELHPAENCVKSCIDHKADQRKAGATAGPTSTVTPFFYVPPPKATNATNGTNATSAEAPKAEAPAEEAA